MKTLATLQILLLIIATIVPEGRWVTRFDADSAASCCCAGRDRQHGTCCCSAPDRKHASSRSCCSRKEKSQQSSVVRAPQKHKRGKLPPCGAIATCPCGGETEVSFVVHAPRCSISRTTVEESIAGGEAVCLLNESVEVERQPPATPPPESFCC